jgi:hypothetical protein
MQKLSLTRQQARRFILAHQGLWPPYGLAGKSGVLNYVRRVGCIQYDPLDVVGRNPELVLQARVADYRPALLEELLYDERRLLDGWDKNMSIYPVEDWPYFRRRREAYRRNPGRSPEAVRSVLPQVRQAIETRGPLSSIDLEIDCTVDWAWAPTRLARAALESMYWWGELIVHHKVHTRKVYDFSHRHLPAGLLAAPDPNPTEEGYHDWYILRRLGAVGLLWNRAGDAWLGMREIKSRARTAALERLLAQDKVLAVAVEGIDVPFYLRRQDEPLLERVLAGSAPPSPAAIIAPLDNLIWDRRLVQALFDFEYVWEVYKPVQERRYGYYVLPVLHGDRFVARFEPGRDDDRSTLLIKNWWWEPDVEPSPELQTALRAGFERFLDYLGAEQIEVDSELVQRERLGWLAALGRG